MAKQSQSIIIIGLKLFIICFLSALLLSLLNSVTKPQVEINRKQAEKDALAVIIKQGEVLEKQEISQDGVVRSLYPVVDQDVVIAYVVELMGQGYGGDMKLLANYNIQGALLSAKLMDNKETPGLGKKAEDSAYMRKFLNKGGVDSEYPLPYTKEMLEMQLSANASEQPEQKLPWFLEFWYWFWGPPKTGNVDSVSGATITFDGVSSALKEGSDYIKSLGGAE